MSANDGRRPQVRGHPVGEHLAATAHVANSFRAITGKPERAEPRVPRDDAVVPAVWPDVRSGSRFRTFGALTCGSQSRSDRALGSWSDLPRGFGGRHEVQLVQFPLSPHPGGPSRFTTTERGLPATIRNQDHPSAGLAVEMARRICTATCSTAGPARSTFTSNMVLSAGRATWWIRPPIVLPCGDGRPWRRRADQR
jgi:hypothetical protein